jgi:hypothetical protein
VGRGGGERGLVVQGLARRHRLAVKRLQLARPRAFLGGRPPHGDRRSIGARGRARDLGSEGVRRRRRGLVAVVETVEELGQTAARRIRIAAVEEAREESLGLPIELVGHRAVIP